MRLTTLTGSAPGDPQAKFILDVTASRLCFGGQSIRLNGKALSFLGLLSFARLQWDDGGKRSPWVTVEEIAKLPDWTGQRLRSSLERQIRREVEKLARRGIDIIEANPGEKTKGPFWLKIPPDRGSPGLAALLETLASFSVPVGERTPDALFDWLESSFDVWRNAFSFDKPETEMSMFEGLAARNRHKGPVLSAMSFITQARGFRETDKYISALREL